VPLTIQNKKTDIWADHPTMEKLKKVFYHIQMMCEDEKKHIFDRDAQRMAPLLEKWGVEAQQQLDSFDIRVEKTETERPKIGQEVSPTILSKLVKYLTKIDRLFSSELEKLDRVLTENYRFFSIIDKNVRQAIYKSCELVHFAESGTTVEPDVDETQFVYVVLQGRVDYMMYKDETKSTSIAATYRSGEVFGDASIQRQFFDVLKGLNKDRNYLVSACQDVYAVRVPKQKFIEAIFAEMSVELMYKILLFRKTPYFQELSPYSLIMFASICEVVDYKYGDIVVA
jgi:hypothetical protein